MLGAKLMGFQFFQVLGRKMVGVEKLSYFASSFCGSQILKEIVGFEILKTCLLTLFFVLCRFRIMNTIYLTS